jgi:hypothetical protein
LPLIGASVEQKKTAQDEPIAGGWTAPTLASKSVSRAEQGVPHPTRPATTPRAMAELRLSLMR